MKGITWEPSISLHSHEAKALLNKVVFTVQKFELDSDIDWMNGSGDLITTERQIPLDNTTEYYNRFRGKLFPTCLHLSVIRQQALR